ncbi:MAG: ATP-binding cassette domain-containing protein [Erysipelothrix sp.]|nr:ATP-binding cassette domain-containing protein [Erysipelothrix sp.]
MKDRETKDPIIVAHDLQKQFVSIERENLLKRTKKYLNVVKSINFSIAPKEIVGFLGPNGAGKSTTIKMLTGILVPTSGECLVNGVQPHLNRVENAKSIGVVFGQKTQLWWDLDVRDNLLLLKEIYELSTEEYDQRYRYLNNILDLDEIKLKQVRTLSLGQRMKADLAAALLHSPKILFLDEPTIGLDVVIKSKILETLKQINRDQQVTILITTHDMRDVESLCDRVIIINHGEIIYDDSLVNLKEKYSLQKRVIVTLSDDSFVNLHHLKTMSGVIDIIVDNKMLTVVIENAIKVEKDVIITLFEQLSIEKIDIQEQSTDDIIKSIYEAR